MPIISTRRWKLILIAASLFVLSIIILKYTFPQLFRPHHYEISGIKAMAYNDNAYPLDENGFLGPGISEALCRSHGWYPYPYALRKSRRKVYDLFIINDEIDWLHIRLNELHHEVDYFVMVESSKTFDGQEKPLHVKENWDSLKAFHHKIIYHELDSTKKPTSIKSVKWDSFHRDATYQQVLPYLKNEKKPQYGDIILVSNVDELPRLSTIKLLHTCNFPRRLTLHSQFYSYSFQWLHRGHEWAHPQATVYLGAITIKPNDLRGDARSLLTSWWWWEYQDLWNAGWHCSNCFPTINETIKKLQLSSQDSAGFSNRTRIVEKVRKGKDLWDRPGEDYDRVVRNEDIPDFVRKNQATYRYMLDRDPENANFRDYVLTG